MCVSEAGIRNNAYARRTEEDKEKIMANTLYAAFEDVSLAEKAVGALLDHGVRAEDVSVVANEGKYADANIAGDTYVADGTTVATGETGGESGMVVDTSTGLGMSAPITYDTGEPASARVVSEDVDDITDAEAAAKRGISTTTTADAGAGALKGAAWGLGVGVVAALASIMVPGVGLVVGGGALATALGGMAATTGAGAVAGGLTGFLKDQGMDDHLAADYDHMVKHGGAMISVHVPSGVVDELEATEVMNKYGATNVRTFATERTAYMG
jgi:uncharacterized membrane protein